MTFGSSLPIIPYRDHTTVGLCRSPYAPGPRSDPYHWQQDVPHAIPIPRSRLKNEKLKCDRNLGWNVEYATAFLVNHLDPANSPDAADVLHKIRLFANKITGEGYRAEVAVKIFGRLDQTLFAGHLKDAVYLCTVRQGHDVSGATYTHGQGPNHRVSRISINLNPDLLAQAPSKHIVATLIHQMIHAYFLVACGPQDEKEVDYGRLSHGMHFAKIMYTIKKLSVVRGHEPLPLNFGHSIPGARVHYDDYQPRYQHHHRHGSKWYCSLCYSYVPIISPGDVEEWYERVCAKMLELPDTVQTPFVHIYDDKTLNLKQVSRASEDATSSADSVEFLLGEKAILVPNHLIDPWIAIRKAFDKTKTRFLEVPDPVPDDAFMTLLELMHTGRYSPDIGPVSVPGRSGPPVIKAMHSDSPPYLLTDVRLFKLGGEMQFDDVKGFAMRRMLAQCITHEDPIAVLQEIYDGVEPDPALREWGRKFLLRTPDGDSAPGLRNAEPPNLVRLEQDMSFKERFALLLDRSGALHIDVLKAHEQVFGSGRTSPVASLTRSLLPVASSSALHSPLSMPLSLPMPRPLTPSPLPLAVRTRPMFLMDEVGRERERERERIVGWGEWSTGSGLDGLMDGGRYERDVWYDAYL